MNPGAERTTYRARKSRSRDRSPPKKYRYTLELVDETRGTVLWRCAVLGTPLHQPQTLEVAGGEAWIVRPNRKIMPSHWLLADPGGSDVLRLDQRIFGKLTGPLTRVGMTIHDLRDGAIHRVVEPDARLAERLLGPDPKAWTVENNDGPVALIASLPKPEQPVTGWRGRIQRFLRGADMGLISLGERHRFGSAESLAILMIFRELRDIAKSAE
jgi:hypothetical protein